MAQEAMTAEEWLVLPDDDRSCELVKGELRTTTLGSFEHGRVAATIGYLIGRYVGRNDLRGVLAAKTGFTLARSPDTVRAPDVAFVRRDRIPPADEQHKFAELGPDLVVEVVSPNDRPAEIEEKVREYLEAGVRLIWIAHPGTRTVQEYRPSAERRDCTSSDELDGYDVLPGFKCDVAEFFE